jgi:hypothetical protein
MELSDRDLALIRMALNDFVGSYAERALMNELLERVYAECEKREILKKGND